MIRQSFFCLLFCIGCGSEPVKQPAAGKIQYDTVIVIDETNYFSPANFNALQKFIRENGRHERVNVSSILDKDSTNDLNVDYYIIDHKGWDVTVDHTHRIYFTQQDDSLQQHRGNILMENDSVRVEGDDSINRQMVQDLYTSVLKSVSKK